MRKKKILIGIAIGVVISMSALAMAVGVFIVALIVGEPAKVTTDINQYGEMFEKKDYELTGYIIFPEEIPKSAQNIDYYHSAKSTIDEPAMEVFLQCTYDDADYYAELQRLENTQKQYGATVRTLMKDEEGRYPYPAYIAVDGDGYHFEYALITGEREITYIYTDLTYSKYLEKVETQYLPSDYDKKFEEDILDGYSIYLVDVERDSNGNVWGKGYDYSRDELVEALDYHPIFVGYNHVGVCTRLNEQDKEIIQYCYYNYYDSLHDSIYGYWDSIEFSELEGYEYKDIALSKDEKRFCVTYYDGEEEKTMEFEIPEV